MQISSTLRIRTQGPAAGVQHTAQAQGPQRAEGPAQASAHCTDTGSSGVIANMHPSSVYMSAKSSTSSSLSSPSSTSTNIHDYNADLNVL